MVGCEAHIRCYFRAKRPTFEGVSISLASHCVGSTQRRVKAEREHHSLLQTAVNYPSIKPIDDTGECKRFHIEYVLYHYIYGHRTSRNAEVSNS